MMSDPKNFGANRCGGFLKSFFLLVSLIGLTACQALPFQSKSKLNAEATIDRIETIRLLPGADVRLSLEDWAKTKSIRAASVLSAVGSLKTATLRFADEKEATKLTGPFELVSLSGLLGKNGLHLHVSVSDKSGKTFGGHVADGCIVYTTLELVIGVYGQVEFVRQLESRTGYSELFFIENR